MSTRSHIGMVMPDTTVKAIYCHHDGYPEYVGKILVEHYSDQRKVEELIALGALSSLEDTIKGCEAYHRDSGENLEIDQHRNQECYLRGESDSCGGGEYRYLWDGKCWLMASVYEGGEAFAPLKGCE